MATQYLLIGEELFQRSATSLNLRCVREAEQAKVLEEIHFD